MQCKLPVHMFIVVGIWTTVCSMGDSIWRKVSVTLVFVSVTLMCVCVCVCLSVCLCILLLPAQL